MVDGRSHSSMFSTRIRHKKVRNTVNILYNTICICIYILLHVEVYVKQVQQWGMRLESCESDY